MRLFTGLPIAPGVAERLLELLHPIRLKVHPQPAENLHVTTKFLGEWPEERLNAVTEALSRVPKPGSFTLEVERLGFFPNDYSPRVLWAGVRAPQALANLARDTSRELSTVGVPDEKRVYSPHVTLARLKPASPLQGMREILIANRDAHFGGTEETEFYLYASRPASGGSVYEKLAAFPL